MEIDFKTGKLTCYPAYEGTKVMIEAKGDVGESRFEVKMTNKFWCKESTSRLQKKTPNIIISNCCKLCGKTVNKYTCLRKCWLSIVTKDFLMCRDECREPQTATNSFKTSEAWWFVDIRTCGGLEDFQWIKSFSRRRLNTISVSAKPFPGITRSRPLPRTPGFCKIFSESSTVAV